MSCSYCHSATHGTNDHTSQNAGQESLYPILNPPTVFDDFEEIPDCPVCKESDRVEYNELEGIYFCTSCEIAINDDGTEEKDRCYRCGRSFEGSTCLNCWELVDGGWQPPEKETDEEAENEFSDESEDED